MEIIKVVVGLLKENCYIVINDNKEAILIDPGSNPKEVEKHLKGYNLKAILLTHGHVDHIEAVPYFKDKYHLPVFAHIFDKELLEDSNANGSIRFSRNKVAIKEGVTYFKDNFEIEGFDIKVLFNPGHTKGSCSFLFDSTYLFSGDFLFYMTVGRVDLYGGDEKTMKESCKMIKKYPSNIKVFPGHGQETTLEEEFLNNPYL